MGKLREKVRTEVCTETSEFIRPFQPRGAGPPANLNIINQKLMKQEENKKKAGYVKMDKQVYFGVSLYPLMTSNYMQNIKKESILSNTQKVGIFEIMTRNPPKWSKMGKFWILTLLKSKMTISAPLPHHPCFMLF